MLLFLGSMGAGEMIAMPIIGIILIAIIVKFSKKNK